MVDLAERMLQDTYYVLTDFKWSTAQKQSPLQRWHSSRIITAIFSLDVIWELTKAAVWTFTTRRGQVFPPVSCFPKHHCCLCHWGPPRFVPLGFCTLLTLAHLHGPKEVLTPILRVCFIMVYLSYIGCFLAQCSLWTVFKCILKQWKSFPPHR